MSRAHRRSLSAGLPWLLGLALAGCVAASDVGIESAQPDGGGLDGAMLPLDGALLDEGPGDDLALVGDVGPQPDMVGPFDLGPQPDQAPAADAGLPLDMAPPPDGGGPDMAPEPPLDCPRLPLGDEETTVGPCQPCRAVGEIPPGFEGWQVLYIDPAAANGGDGSLERPLSDLADAASRAAPRTVLALAPGEHAGPVSLDGPMALVGTCADEVRITAPADQRSVVFAGGGAIVLDGITVQGGGVGVALENGSTAEIRHSVVGGADLGVSARGVATVAIADSRIEGAAQAQVRVVDSGLAVIRSVIGLGAGAGIIGADAGRAVPCADSVSPVCPYRHGIYVADSHVTDVFGAGIESVGGRLHVRGSVIDGIDQGEAGGEPVGIATRQSFVVVRGSVIRRVAASAVDDALGLGLWLRSSRVHVEDSDIEQCGRGGVQIDRLPPEELVDFVEGGLEPPAQWFPGEAWSPLPEAFAGDGFEPGVDWFPGEAWAPRPDELPFQLRPETPEAQQSPELGLFRWARGELRAVRVEGHPSLGVELGGHAVRVTGGRVSDIAAGPALAIRQRSEIALDLPGAEVVALGEVLTLQITETGGSGVEVHNVALVCGTGGDGAAPCSVPLPQGGPVPRGLRAQAVDLGHHLYLSGVRILETAGLGLSLVDSVATLERNRLEGVQGIGVWSYGSRVTLLGNEIRDVRFHNLQGRFDAVDIADGIIIEPTRAALSQRAVVRDNSVISARRVGVLLVNDRIDLELDLSFAEGELAENGLDVVMLGENRNLQGVDGADVQNRDEEEIPPPALPRPEPQ